MTLPASTNRVLAATAALCTGLAVVLSWAEAPRTKSSQPVVITAYINQTSGCQKHTEDFLRSLAARYAGKVRLEFVNFGEPEGRRRWLADGCHCMTIRINGKEQMTVWEKGVPLQVRFVMPAGYMWRHEELALAVRQAVNGVSDEDRRPPGVEVRKNGDKWELRIDGTPVLALSDQAPVKQAAAVLQSVAREKGLVQEDFSLHPREDGAVDVLVRGTRALTATKADAEAAGASVENLARRWLQRIRSPYPVRTRPFPHGKGPRKIQRHR